MSARSVFEIVGPVMIGPSSSHTAGAVRIGRVARAVLADQPAKVEIILFGSFARTYKGHGTDKALVGGMMGMDTDDRNIKDALSSAAAQGMEVKIETSDAETSHPNTVSIKLIGLSGKVVSIEGSSIGGGNIVISKINKFEVAIYGRYPTLLVQHDDKPGVIGRVTSELGKSGINIAEMKMSRNQKGAHNFAVIETDQTVGDHLLEQVTCLSGIIKVTRL